MRHFRHKIDANQAAIVRALKDIPGLSVLDIHNSNLSDVIVGFRGRNILLEIKNPDVKPSDRKLTERERIFHSSWHGQIAVVHTLDEALAVIRLA